jgi:UDP-N-acetylglucosamine/UDP-N-acetylgalactosamine diphosphorylase
VAKIAIINIMQTTMMDRTNDLGMVLEGAGQAHVWQHLQKLKPVAQNELMAQVRSIDWNPIARLIQSHVVRKPKFVMPGNLEPAKSYPPQPTPDLAAQYREARALGEQLIRGGQVAAFTVAGGQGTRLGWDAPKGTFAVTPIRKLALFACFAEYLQKTQTKYRCRCPWYIMTSPANDADTRAYFEKNRCFSLDPRDVMFFPQAMMPAFDLATGQVLFESPTSLALSPDGHGGSLKALYRSDALSDMQRRGITQISYFQVDNPTVHAIDPLFIGLHALDGCQMSSKMVPKAYPREKLGNFCLVDGRVTIIEYSDLPDELAEQRIRGGPQDGQLRFRAGSIAVHVIRVDFVQSLNASKDFGLPYHRAEKKVPCWDFSRDALIEPSGPNAVKLETFVFDALPLCERSIIYETDRVEEFAPVKNADGADSPATCRALQIERAGRWLQSKNVIVPRDPKGEVDAVIEISPLTAIEPDDLNPAQLPKKIDRGSQVLL